MNDVDLIALAGLLHDIGKFGQRADEKPSESDWQTYCPKRNGFYSHKHAAYTAKILGDFIVEKQKDNSRVIRAKALNGNFINIAAKHHKPETKEEWIVAAADRLASGFERDVFEEYNERVEEEVGTDYKEQRLDHLFDTNGKFPLDILAPHNIFSSQEPGRGYKELWKDFIKELKLIIQSCSHFPEHIKTNALEYLLKKYTSFMPSSTSFKHRDYDIVKPNVSLYEHLKTTSVFASAIASMPDENRQIVINYYKQRGDKQGELEKPIFLLIAGDFFGIQSFIFDEASTKFAAKTLRAKSAFIQVLVKVLAFYATEKLGVSKYSIISTHAGKFEILVPNKSGIVEKLQEVQRELDEYFLKEFFGLTGVGIAWTGACMADFLVKRDEKEGNRYKKLRQRLGESVEEMKFKKFGLENRGYKIFDIDSELDNQNLCDFCHKRKGERGEEYVICSHCERFVKMGKALVDKKYMAISKEQKGENDIEVFKGYWLHLFDDPSAYKAQNDIAIYDISTDLEFRGIEKWELSSYVAKKSDFRDYEKFLKSKDEEFFQSDILTLEELAALSVKEGIEEDKRVRGIEAIMALKGDADGMGDFIKSSDVTDSFAKYNFFARMVDYYFSVYTPLVFMDKKQLYTVFAGGDDLFVLGAWDEAMELARRVRDDFVKFTTERLTFSTGLVMSKANKPINFLASKAEEELEKAKDFCCEIKDERCEEICDETPCEGESIKEKDAVSLFDQTAAWRNYGKVKDKFMNNFHHPKGEEFKTAFLYHLLELALMSTQVKCNGDVKATIWKSKLSYLYRRNISEHNIGLLQYLNETIEKYPKEFMMVLVEYIYKRRRS